MPVEIDEIDRRVMQLEIELTSLEKETDAASAERREALERELAELKERSAEMKARWQNEKQAINDVSELKERLEQARMDAERAQRESDYERASQLLYQEIPELEGQLAEQEQHDCELREGTTASFLKEEVDADDVAEVVARWTGIPVSRLLEGETEKLIHMEDRLHERVIGQDEAVEAVATALRRSRAGLQDPDRPIGTFLFLGPTGVGKTELARALAEFMFDSAGSDDPHRHVRVHGETLRVAAGRRAPGLRRLRGGRQLTEAVRRRPYSVILLDEIEKANGDVFNILLQVFDDGRLTDGQGRTVDFKNTVIIMTSNIPIPEGLDDAEAREALLQSFKPEFINRLDDIVRFKPLRRDQISEIVDLQVRLVLGRVAERGVSVTLSDDAKTLLGNLGYDPAYGARPLRRVIQKQLTDKLALALLKGDIREGDSVTVDAADGELVIEKAGERLVEVA